MTRQNDAPPAAHDGGQEASRPPAGGVIDSRDVADREQAEEALRRSEALLAEAQHLAQIGSWRWDIRTGRLEWSAENYRVFGIDPDRESPTHEFFVACLHPADRQRVMDLVAAARRGELTYDCEYRIVRPDAAVRVLHARGRVIRNEVGEAVQMIGMAQDVTDRKRDEERLQDLSRRLIRSQEEECRHIARELHDEIGQALTAVTLNVRAVLQDLTSPAAAGRLEEVLALVRRTTGQVRDLSLDLHPSLLDDLGLLAALRSYVTGFRRRLGVEAEFVAGEGIGRTDPDVETACYRVAQEALTNAARHSGAGRLRVELSRTAAELLLVVADDGCGFDVEAATARAVVGSSLGVLGMRERARLVGGRVRIASEPGEGSVVRAVFPLGRPPDPPRTVRY